MVSTKTIRLIIEKPYDYKPILERERKEVTKYIGKEVLELANRFDGPSKLTIKVTGKGNA